MSANHGNETPGSTPVKVILWSTPRSLSTAFLKCMTYVPDTVAWFEPFHQMSRVGEDNEAIVAEPFSKLVDKMGGKAAVDQITGGFDSANTSFDWLKRTLEGDFPGKKLVIVKAMSAIVAGFQKLDKIPSGFRHTFLIRHPHKVAKSLTKIVKGPDVVSTNDALIGKAFPFKASYEILQHIKKENPDVSPVIMDADDLLDNPAGMIAAYCKACDIPYSDDLLQWKTGNEVITKLWMLPKETILTYPALGVHDAVFTSTCFKKSRAPLPSLEEFPEQLAQVVAVEMPYYEKLYAERLKC